MKLPPGVLERGFETLRRSDVLVRIAMCFAIAVLLWAVTGAWAPPFSYRIGDIPERNLVARVPFETIDETATRIARSEVVAKFECIYRNDIEKLKVVQQALRDEIFKLLSAESYEKVDKKVWERFAPQSRQKSDIDVVSEEISNAISDIDLQSLSPIANPAVVHPKTQQLSRALEFERFREAFVDDPELKKLTTEVGKSMSEFVNHGLFESPEHKAGEGSLSRIQVYTTGNPDYLETFDVDQVRKVTASSRLKKNLENDIESKELAGQIYSWLDANLPTTLTFDQELSKAKANEKAAAFPDVMIPLKAGDSVLVNAGQPITATSFDLLRREHAEFVDSLSLKQMMIFSAAKFGMYTAIYVLCGFYIYFRQRWLLKDIKKLARLLVLVLITIGVSWFAAPTRFELIPLLIFCFIIVIIHEQELALLLSSCVALLLVLSKGYNIIELVTCFASMSTAILLIRHVRTRTKLIYVSVWTSLATFLTAVGVSIVAGGNLDLILVQNASWMAACCIAAGLLMTGLLPFIERVFDVQTDLSLLELGDVAHPLLQELVRRAPGTYNHSINVASIAQAAAETIGANGLLVRVGAYFHDIGKMLKPQYFVENQMGDNRHESLLPAMSTLVIIAHVKDGADLARQHNLPEAIVDFVLQHHGTTLVEYFYHRANQQQREDDPEAETLDEGNYRYPGPKPQTKEAAVLMLSDAVESAGRALVDPGPSRIESLVEDIAMKRLLDGQFDECGLTLEELRVVQDSITKSLTAVYHGRIKYPDQQTA